MAPTPSTPNNLTANPTTAAKSDVKYWTKANIAVTAVFAILFLAIFLVLLAFFLHRHAQRKKHLHATSDQTGLLQHEDKTNMFSRERPSSVTLYVDTEADNARKRASTETMSLKPLKITSLEEVHDPLNTSNTMASTGSGVSALSRLSTNTASTILLSPISPGVEERDMGLRTEGRPRSTSTASQRARYYDSVIEDVELRNIPKIAHTSED
jgi:hypothetical protein